MASPLSSPRARSSSRAAFRCQCLERTFARLDEAYPVKLVTFDFDETLTLITYLIEDGDSEKVQKQIVRTNFQTPWVKGSRIENLKSMLKALSTSNSGQRRPLAVLTKNYAGQKAVHLLLHIAGLARYFDAIWALPSGGLYRCQDEWYEMPTPNVNHKADLLALVVESPSEFLPQLTQNIDEWKDFGGLKMEGIVLVDDQRANFQSPSGAQVLRFCKVARYDGYYRNLGYVKNMGGIGAHCAEDYETLKMFVEAPSTYKETLCLHCVERHFENSSAHQPVDLIIFDFDETLTLATFMPSDRDFDDLGWEACDLETDWSVEDLLSYNFESPFQSGRLTALRQMLQALSQRYILVILSNNDRGAAAVLNLLRLADLASNFEAIWTAPFRQQVTCGVFRSPSGIWQDFEPPVLEVADEKTEILHHIVANPIRWFPQMLEGAHPRLTTLRPESVILVDDERQNLQHAWHASKTALRYCKVARYDEVYRSCGPLNQLGGIGAHSLEDFEVLQRFAQTPWLFQEPHFPEGVSSEDDVSAAAPYNASRLPGSRSEEWDKLPRRRDTLPRSLSSPSLRPQPQTPPMSRSQSFCLSDGMSPRATNLEMEEDFKTEMCLIGMDE